MRIEFTSKEKQDTYEYLESRLNDTGYVFVVEDPFFFTINIVEQFTEVYSRANNLFRGYYPSISKSFMCTKADLIFCDYSEEPTISSTDFYLLKDNKTKYVIFVPKNKEQSYYKWLNQ